MSKRILIISPHLDDAALSASDYILYLLKNNHDVSILTVFNKFSKTKTNDAIKYVNDSGYKNITTFEENRIIEDINAMKELNVKYQYLDYTDGGFRNDNNKPIYRDHKQLFSGSISDKDAKLQISLLNKFIKLNSKYDKIVIPYGIGNHIDHLIVKKIAQQSFDKNKIQYYIDFPYAMKVTNWNIKNIANVIKSNKKLFVISQKKKIIISKYKSQIPLLFRFKKYIWYPEIILT